MGDIARLAAVRTQLVTLFLMAIFLQNSLEILFPWLGAKIKGFCAAKEEEEYLQSQAGRPDDALLSDQDIEAVEQVNAKSNVDVMNDINLQMQLGVSPDVLDNTAEVVVLHGYIMLFVIIFPLMPLLASINNYIELRVDFFNLIHTQRPIPASAAGLGVWKSVLSCFNIIAVFSNIAILTFRTPLIHELLNRFGYDSDLNLIIFYFCMVLFLLFVIFVIRIAIDDKTTSTKEALARQEACERHLLMAPMQTAVRGLVKKQKKLKQSQMKLDIPAAEDKQLDEENKIDK